MRECENVTSVLAAGAWNTTTSTFVATRCLRSCGQYSRLFCRSVMLYLREADYVFGWWTTL